MCVLVPLENNARLEAGLRVPRPLKHDTRFRASPSDFKQRAITACSLDVNNRLVCFIHRLLLEETRHQLQAGRAGGWPWKIVHCVIQLQLTNRNSITLSETELYLHQCVHCVRRNSYRQHVCCVSPPQVVSALRALLCVGVLHSEGKVMCSLCTFLPLFPPPLELSGSPLVQLSPREAF